MIRPLVIAAVWALLRWIGDWKCFFCGQVNALLDAECIRCGRLPVSLPGGNREAT